MNYITQTDLEHYMGVTLSGNGLNLFNLIQAPMQEMVNQYCNRTWDLTNPIVETFDAYTNLGSDSATLVDTFYPKYMVDTTPYDNNHPQAGGVRSVLMGVLNGQGGTSVDLTYVYNYKTSIKISSWFAFSPIFNPYGFKSVQITYNTSDAGVVPSPVKLALLQWCARILQTSMDAGKETTRVETGPIKAHFKEDQLSNLPDFVRFVLDRYRIIPVERF